MFVVNGSSVRSVDLVIDPATVRGLFEADNPSLNGPKMSWKIAEFQQFNTDRITRGDGYSPTLAVAFRLPDAALEHDLNADVAKESDGPMRAAVEKWRNESGHYGRHATRRASSRTTKRRDDAQAKSASLQAAVDEALFDGRQPDQLGEEHDAATRELKAAEYRLQRLSGD